MKAPDRIRDAAEAIPLEPRDGPSDCSVRGPIPSRGIAIPDLASPRCAALARAVAAGDAAAVARFWRDVERSGTPIVEPVDDDRALVTFLWRGEDAAVALQSPAGDVNPAANQLTRLPGTDVWRRTLVLPAGTRMQYEIGVAASREALDRGWDAFDWRPDPLNPRRHLLPSDPEGTFQGYPASVVELPGAPAQPWVEPRAGTPAGRVDERRLTGPRAAERRLWLYIPATAPPAGLLVLFDGWTYRHVVPTPTVLDNLIADRRIPPIAALLVDTPDRRRELSFDEEFTTFVADELVPLAREATGAAASADDTIVGGSSLGGVAAVFAALRRRDVFGVVLSLSGAFWVKGPDGAYEWLVGEAARLASRPFRAYLAAGVLEGQQFADAPTLYESNRAMADALRALGCEVTAASVAGGHDPLCWRGSLADGLVALLGGSGRS